MRKKKLFVGFPESHLLAFHTLRIVYSMEKTPIVYCITHLLLMTLHSELLPYQTLSYFVSLLHHSFVANDASFGTFALSDVILFC